MIHYSWHKLDNSAKIYPFLMNKEHQNLFRITVEMKEEVNPKILNDALNNIIERFPLFNVSLKRGIFWHYYDQLNGKLTVHKDSDLLIKPLTTVQKGGYSFRVSYYDKRIAVDFFHALCDGSGAIEFVKTLAYEYLILQGKSVNSDEKILLPNSAVTKNEIDDGFNRYAEKIKLKDMKGVDDLRGQTAFKIDNFKFDYSGFGVIQGDMNIDQLLALAHKNNVSLTAYISAVLVYSIYKTKRLNPKNNPPVVLFIPINLRKIFPSKTLLNFSLFSRCMVDINGDVSFEKILEKTQQALKKDTDKKLLQNNMNVTVKTEKLWILRIMPLAVKELILKIASLFFSDDKKTMTFSNVGIIDVPKDMDKYIDKFTFMLSTNKSTPCAVTMSTTFKKATVTFTRRIIDTEIEKCFFRFLQKQGIDITVTSNYWEDK